MLVVLSALGKMVPGHDSQHDGRESIGYSPGLGSYPLPGLKGYCIHRITRLAGHRLTV
ncbi:MAG: hypothetical protein OXF20_01115 [Gammaproteobacteria bacterium]|nr:hypothetical protein [Gammaproteobacteria bacterium]